MPNVLRPANDEEGVDLPVPKDLDDDAVADACTEFDWRMRDSADGAAIGCGGCRRCVEIGGSTSRRP